METADPAADPAARPGETQAQRADRNFGELLQELRVAQTGVQILLAFLLTVPFAAGFADLDEASRRLFALTVVLAATSMTLLVAPVTCHRLAFRKHRKDLILKVSHVLTLLGLGVLAATVLCGVYLAVDTALGPGPARAVSAACGVVMVLGWVVLPLYVRSATPHDVRDD